MPRSRQPKEIWLVTRQKVLKRDKYRCLRCGINVTETTAHVDHVISGKLGSNNLTNLRTLCRRCHVLRNDLRHRGLTDLDIYYQEASAPVRKKLLGSIFTGKLIFEDGKYRTSELNEAVNLIYLFQKNLENKKNGNIAISENVSGNVPMTGLEPAPSCEE